jgi:GGDEF domain-containing protein
MIGVAEIFFERKNKKDILNELEILRKEVFHDPLTGAGNRRVANITFEQMHARLIDSSVPYGVIFVDIDFFKDVNDKWGHLIGDLLLQMVAKTLESGLRPMDILCRWEVKNSLSWFQTPTMKRLVLLPSGYVSLLKSLGLRMKEKRFG